MCMIAIFRHTLYLSVKPQKEQTIHSAAITFRFLHSTEISTYNAAYVSCIY
jgi:hypothetical protein